MRVILPVPATWACQPKGPLLLYQIRGVPGLVVLVSPLQAYPEDAGEWMRRQFTTEAIPAGATVTMTVSGELTTDDGWPMTYAEGQVTDGAEVEARVVVLYRFVDHGAGVIIRCPRAAIFAQHRREVLDVLGAATPEWGAQDTVCLGALFDGVVKPGRSVESRRSKVEADPDPDPEVT